MAHDNSAALPTARLEVRPVNGRPTVYEVGDGGFLIGTVPGCDLRLPGSNLPPVLCLIARHAGGASLRKLAPIQALTVNGKAVNSTALNNGDRIGLGLVEIAVALTPGIPAVVAPSVDHSAASREIEERQRELQEQAEQLANERRLWNERRAEQPPAATEEHEELLKLRKELATIRQQLYQRYHARRDRLNTKEKAIRKAADKLLARKRDLDAKTGQINKSHQEWSLREAELEARTEQVQRERRLLEEQARELTTRQQELHKALADRVQEVQAREKQIAEDRGALDRSQKQHQGDLVRLDRIQATIEQQRKQLQANALDVDRRFEQLQRDTRDLEEQAKQMDEWHQRLAGDTERLAKQKQEQDSAGLQIDQRAAAIEGQQAMLATLRTRLERMREELRRQEQSLSDQRALQEAGEADLEQRTLAAQQMRAELDNDKQLFEEEHKRLEETQQTLAAAVAQLRQAQQSLSDEEKALYERRQQIDATAQEQAEQASTLLVRGSQIEELHRRLKTDRDALHEREQTLAQAEQTVAALQEQLRRRSEELLDRQRLLSEQEEKLTQEKAAFEARCQSLEQEQRQTAERLEALRLDILAREEELAKKTQAVAEKEVGLRAEALRLEEADRTLAAQRQGLVNERIGVEVERQATNEAATRSRTEFEAARTEALQIQRLVPELEARAAAALDRLTRGRAQLREHLAELHAYAQQSRDDLETAHKHIQSEVERVRQQELSLHVARDEHRLAVAAFRQQLIDWQGQVGEMKQTLQNSGTQLDRRQAEVDAQAQQIASTTARLAQQAEELDHKERQVAEKRGEMDRHLTDMREWYRRKLRELAGVDRSPDDDPSGANVPQEGDVMSMPAAVVESLETADELRPAAEGHNPERGILSLTGEVDPGDRSLGELLRSLDLMDADTLMTLLLEARRQRRSLRQLLLAGNYLTLYQMALIEASNLDGLVLGPVRVVDRLRATPREAVYRIFDPRHNREAQLRHLAEDEMQDAVRPDEFRQRFAAAATVAHPNLAATYEVLEIGGRPAVLQEWLRGVPSGEWTALAAAPGVWFRLLGQAALALHTAHSAGLVHGRLQPESFVFTGDGVLKLCGLGEPRWLGAESSDGTEPTPAGDLLALGTVAAGWEALGATGKKTKAKAFPDILQTILQHLTAAHDDDRFPSATALLDELDRISGDVPANGAAWDRFIKFAREQAGDAALRESA